MDLVHHLCFTFENVYDWPVDACHLSETVIFDGLPFIPWCIRAEKTSADEDDEDEEPSLALYLQCKNHEGDWSVKASFTIRLLSFRSEYPHKQLSTEYVFKPNTSFGFRPFVCYSEMGMYASIGGSIDVQIDLSTEKPFGVVNTYSNSSAGTETLACALYEQTLVAADIAADGEACGADHEVEVKGQVIRCHQFALKCRIPFFASLFSAGLVEASSRRTSLTPDFATPEAFRTILRYVYLNELCLDMDTFVDVYRLAHYLSIDWVVDKCSEHAIATISRDNWPVLCQLSATYSDDRLYEALQGYYISVGGFDIRPLIKKLDLDQNEC